MFVGRKKLLPGQMILFGFAAVILIGALLLTLPFATRDRQGASFADGLFTAVSATCVTGLVVQDTYTYWSMFGQFVILCLIQIGGMGVVTVAIGLSIFMGRRIGFGQRFLMQESISAPQVGGIIRMTGFILHATAAIELGGAVVLSFRFVPRYGLFKGLWFSLFHAVSAFCNAGFDLMGGAEKYASLTGFADDPLISLAIPCLIIIGGIGFGVWDDIRRKKLRLRAYRLQSKLALVMTALLLTLPLAFFFFYEFSRPAWDTFSTGQRFLAAFFQTVTPRTAGFNTVSLPRMAQPSILLTIFLMLTGGCPGSTAGGYKTTTLATMALCVRAVFRKQDGIQCFGRRLPQETLRQCLTIFVLYLFFFVLGGMILCCAEGISMEAALFEAASAIGTVGLSLGVTPYLGGLSRCVLMFLMFFGRMGGLTMIYALSGNHAPIPGMMPQEKITVG